MRWILWLSIAGMALTLLVTIVFFGWWSMEERIEFGKSKFNQVAWIQADVSNTCQRGEMAYHLQQKGLPPGLPRAAVAVLLGRPSYEDGISMQYDLGKCLDAYHGLFIFFDRQDRLIKSSIRSH